MNSRNALALGLILILGALLPTFPGLAASSPTQGATQSGNCSQQIDQRASIEYRFQAQAISIAQNAGQVKGLSQTYTTAYDSVFDRWAFDSNCNVTLTSVNVVFQLSNNNGFAGYAVAMEDSGVTHVLNVSLQQHNPRASITSTFWSGYELTASLDVNVPVWESIGDWSVPSVSQPFSNACQDTNHPCDVFIWPGLVNTGGNNGASGIAQTGSESKLTCVGSACNQSIDLWYEFWPQQSTAVVCLTGVVNGDSIHAYVLNQGWNGGDQTLWNLQITDQTRGGSCTVTGHSFNIGKPYYAEFITERPLYTDINQYATLPSFTQISIAGNMYYSGAVRGIYGPYTNGWYNLYVMQNGCSPPNISTSAVNSGNSFTETWNNSCGT